MRDRFDVAIRDANLGCRDQGDVDALFSDIKAIGMEIAASVGPSACAIVPTRPSAAPLWQRGDQAIWG